MQYCTQSCTITILFSLSLSISYCSRLIISLTPRSMSSPRKKKTSLFVTDHHQLVVCFAIIFQSPYLELCSSLPLLSVKISCLSILLQLLESRRPFKEWIFTVEFNKLVGFFGYTWSTWLGIRVPGVQKTMFKLYFSQFAELLEKKKLDPVKSIKVTRRTFRSTNPSSDQPPTFVYYSSCTQSSHG